MPWMQNNRLHVKEKPQITALAGVCQACYRSGCLYAQMEMRTEFKVASKKTIFVNADKQLSSRPLSENVYSSIDFKKL